MWGVRGNGYLLPMPKRKNFSETDIFRKGDCMEIRFSVDNVTWVAHDVSLVKFSEYKERLLSNFEMEPFEILSKGGSSVTVYKKIKTDKTIEIEDENGDLLIHKGYYRERQIHLQYIYGKDICRMEYNPNVISSEVAYFIEEGLTKEMFPERSMSRMDIALDIFGKDMTFLRLARPRVKTNFIMGSDGVLETQYYGMRKSDVMVRIYNKGRERRQLFAKGSLYEDFPEDLSELARKNWYRVEMQIRTKRIDDWKELFLECIDQMYFLVDENLAGHDFKVIANVIALRYKPELWGLMPKRTKARYKSLFAEEFSDEGFKEETKKLLLEQVAIFEHYFHLYPSRD